MQRNFNAEVASRDHHRVGRIDDGLADWPRPLARSSLAMMGRSPPNSRIRLANSSHVGGLADVAGRKIVGLLLDGQGYVIAVLVRNLERQVGVWKVDALPGRDRPADHDDRFGVALRAAWSPAVPRGRRRSGVVVPVWRCRRRSRSPRGIATSEASAARVTVSPLFSKRGPFGISPSRYLGPMRSKQDGHVEALVGRDLSNPRYVLSMLLRVAVREIEAHDVDSGVEESAQRRLRRSWPAPESR